MKVWPHQLLSMPFPLEDGTSMAELRLPARGLTRNEAERLKVYIDSLVIVVRDDEPNP